MNKPPSNSGSRPFASNSIARPQKTDSTKQYRAVIAQRSPFLFSLFLLFVVTVIIAPNVSGQSDIKHVLLLQSEAKFLPANIAIDQGIRTTLTATLGNQVDYFNESLDQTRFPGNEYELELRDFLRRKYSQQKLDLIIVSGPTSVSFLDKYRDEIFPDAPVVICGITIPALRALHLGTNTTAVALVLDVKATLDLALQLQPDTRRVAVVSGKAPVDQAFLTAAREGLRDYESRLQFSYLTGLPMDQLQQELSKLPEHTIIFYSSIVQDGTGLTLSAMQAFAMIAPYANSPIYSFFAPDSGLVGGKPVNFQGHGAKAAALGLRIFNGEKAASILPITDGGDPLTVDWRQLKRWKLSESRLPAGTVVRFKDPSVWEQYKWRIIGIAAVVVLEALLIAGLLFQRRKRHFAQRELAERLQFERLLTNLSATFVNLPVDQIETEIDKALKGIAEFLKLDRAGFFEFADNQMSLRLIRSFVAEGITPYPEVVALESLPWYLERLRQGVTVDISDVELDLPSPSPEKTYWIESGIHSALAIPISIGDEQLFVMTCGTFAPRSVWPAESINRLRSIAEVFANALDRKHRETRLREKERALAESDDRLRSIIDNTSALIYLKDENSRYLLVNKEFERLFASTEEILGKSDYDVMPAELADKLRANDQQVLQLGKPLEFEEVFLQNGALHTYISMKVPIFYGLRNAQVVCGISTDITSRKHTEEALRESEERYRDLVESSQDLICTHDLEGRVLSINRGALDILGYEHSAVVGGNIRQVLQPEYVADFDAYLGAIEKNGQAKGLMYVQTANGETRIWEYNNTLRTQGVPAPVVRGLAHDVTERKHAEGLSKSMLASLSGLVAVVDKDGTVIGMNDGARGMPADNGNLVASIQVGGNYIKSWRDANGGASAIAQRALAGVLSVLGGSRDSFSLEYAQSNGLGQRWIEITVQPLQRPEGGAVISHLDVTNRKLAELEIQSNRQELTHFARVAAMGELTASLAHELNQPLTAIMSNTQAAQRFLRSKTPDLEELSNILADVIADDRRAGEVIRRLRSLLKRGELEMSHQDLNSLIVDVDKLLHSDAVIKNIQVVLQLDRSLPPVWGDRVQLQQVILNLMINGMDAMRDSPRDHRRLTVRTSWPDHNLVKVEVEDAGMGISPDKLDQIFHSFYTTKAEGMGMGLSISRSIIELHGGRLWAVNNRDRGATFCFSVPTSDKAST